jgi:hypothetical protein
LPDAKRFVGFIMSPDRDSILLLQEWMRTVDDYFKSCVELQRLAASGNQDDAGKAESEARELRLIAGHARRRYWRYLRRQRAQTGAGCLKGDVKWSTRTRSSASKGRSN